MEMKNCVLFVVTSHSQLGETGKQTGYFLPEVTHPYFQLLESGFQVDIASPKGGKAPLDKNSYDLSDETNKRFMDDPKHRQKLENTITLSSIDPNDYDAVFFAGGHGTMWDFYPNEQVNQIASAIYEKGGIVAAVCHGPAALLNVKLSNGKYLVSNKKITGFSNAEEAQTGLSNAMPFLLETELISIGGNFESADLWQEKVVVSDRLVTGQNPSSATGVGKAMAELLLR